MEVDVGGNGDIGGDEQEQALLDTLLSRHEHYKTVHASLQESTTELLSYLDEKPKELSTILQMYSHQRDSVKDEHVMQLIQIQINRIQRHAITCTCTEMIKAKEDSSIENSFSKK